jgi:hypothetical protein
MRMVRRTLFVTACVGSLAAVVAQAVIPLTGRTLQAITEVNRASGRTQAIQLELTLRIGTEPPVASAELISHPSGLARLEIRGYDGRVDRYLLTGDELLGTMNGNRIGRPGPLLQPLFLIQPSSESTLRTALETFGIRSDVIGLAPCGDEDCFVLGDPRLEAPLPPEMLQPRAEALEDLGLDRDGSAAPRFDPSTSTGEIQELIVDGRLPRFWVDTEALQPQRIDREDGVVVVFGPVASYERVKVPAWFEIHRPDEAFPMRFEVDRAVQVNAPPNAFDRDWVFAPGRAEKKDPS